MTESERNVIVLSVVVLSLVIWPIGAAGGVASGLEGDTAVALAQTDDGNETIRHKHPDEYAEEGDSEAIEGWLVDRLTGMLESGVVQLEDGEYDGAGATLDEEYLERLAQYDEIADGAESERRAELLEHVREEQLRTVNATRRYNETRAEYEQAVEEGDDERAREHAHELEDIAQNVTDSSSDLRAVYGDLENESDADLGESNETIERVADDVRDYQEDVRDEQFTLTTLRIDREGVGEFDPISFLDPLVADGHLRTEDGDPVANETVHLEIGNETIRRETDANGTFDLEYRPKTVPLSTDELTVQYVPDDESIYLGSETTVEVSIEQVDPTVSSLEAPDELAFGDNATVEGALTADGVPVDSTPLEVTLGNESLGTTNTSNGSFVHIASVPASVPDGERDLGVRLAVDGDDRALAATNETTPVAVRETETDLALEATAADGSDRTIELNGTLETTDGDAVANESVTVLVDGTAIDPVTTGEDGSFTATTDVDTAGDVSVEAAYGGAGTSLAAAQATATVTFPTATEDLPWSVFPAPVWIVLGLAVALGFGAVFVRYQRRSRSDGRSGTRLPLAASEGEPTPAPMTEAERESIARSTFSRALEYLSSGRPDDAVQLCYVSVRVRLESRLDLDERGPFTHWEFYYRYRTHENADDDRLGDVTRGYEHATFADEGLSTHEAADVLDAARRLCDLDADVDLEGLATPDD